MRMDMTTEELLRRIASGKRALAEQEALAAQGLIPEDDGILAAMRVSVDMAEREYLGRVAMTAHKKGIRI